MKSSQPEQNIPDEIEGDVICDDKLNDMFEDDIPKVAIYGDIQPTKEIIDFLNIPTGFRTYTKMSKLNEEVRNEEAATHERWRFMFNPDDSPEEMRKMRDHENRMRMVYNDQKICFSNLRAMDFSQNKEIKMPGPVYISNEMKIQLQKDNHREAINKRRSSHSAADKS